MQASRLQWFNQNKKVTSGLINQNDQKGLWWKMGGGADQLQWHVYLKLDIAKFQ